MARHSILAAAAGGLLAALAATTAADALPLAKAPTAPQGIVEQTGPRGGGGFHGGGGPRFHGGGGPRFHGGPRFGGGPRFHGPGFPRHFHGPRFRGGFYPYAYGFGAYPYYYDGFYDDYSYSDCAPLRRRALQTGKRYWWNRYHACIDG